MKPATSLLCAILVATTGYQAVQGQSTDKQKPNVIFINVDDLGYKDVGFMGSRYYETPNIDRLAREGMIFTRGYAGAANCAPSRAALLSGQNSPRTGVYTVANSDRGDTRSRRIIPTKNTRHLSNDILTLGHLFQKAGYTTATFGKWHVGEDPLDHGFDVNFGGNHRGNPGKDGYVAPYNKLPNLEAAPEGEYLTDRLTTEAIGFIQANRSNRFLAYLTYYTVHTPLMGKEKLIAKYEKKGGQDGQNNPVYAAMVENLDTNIGRVLAKVDDLGLRDSTLVIFTSDNGGIRAISSQHPLRAGKGSYYEGGIRVPYCIRWPGVITPGSRSDTPIVNLDFFPTFMEILDVELTTKDLDGVSILPMLRGEEIQQRPLFWHFPIYLQAYRLTEDDGRDPLFRTRPGSVVMLGNWKLHEYFEDSAIELYDLAQDIGERNNLAARYPEKAAELKAILDDWRDRIQAPVPRDLNPAFDESYLPANKWLPIFNRQNLDGWTVKIRGYPLGENFGNTFRVEDGIMKVGYGAYGKFDDRFGHIFYKDSYSHYRIRVEYRFVGDQCTGGPGWAYRNSGIMVHGQDPNTMTLDQDFPASIEVQLLGGRSEGVRTTSNLCTPGTNVVMDGELITRHCTNSTSRTYRGDDWVVAEVEVRGSAVIRHILDEKVVLEYTEPQLDPRDEHARKLAEGRESLILTSGSISLQSESHPVEFRRVELMILEE